MQKNLIFIKENKGRFMGILDNGKMTFLDKTTVRTKDIPTSFICEYNIVKDTETEAFITPMKIHMILPQSTIQAIAKNQTDVANRILNQHQPDTSPFNHISFSDNSQSQYSQEIEFTFYTPNNILLNHYINISNHTLEVTPTFLSSTTNSSIKLRKLVFNSMDFIETLIDLIRLDKTTLVTDTEEFSPISKGTLKNKLSTKQRVDFKHYRNYISEYGIRATNKSEEILLFTST